MFWQVATGVRQLATLRGDSHWRLESGSAATVARYGSLLMRISVHTTRILFLFFILFTVCDKYHCLCVIQYIYGTKVCLDVFTKLNVKTIECLTECLWLNSTETSALYTIWYNHLVEGNVLQFMRKVRIEWQPRECFDF